MKPLVLMTRPQPEADRFAEALAEMGYDTLIEPLYRIVPSPSPWPDESPAALVATSPKAFFSQVPPDWAEIPVFVMGETSAAKAARCGCHNIISAAGDFSRLVKMVRKEVTSGKKILYLRGEATRHDLQKELPGLQVVERIVYRSEKVATFPPRAREAIANGRVAIVPLFSPRAAVDFSMFLRQEGLEREAERICLLCLSPAVLDSARHLVWKRAEVAKTPDSAAMLAVMQEWTGLFE